MHAELRSELSKKYSEEIAESENQKLIKDLGPIMDLTYGIAVYQEQLMFLVQSMA
jgi:DNA polymerase III alpha subunit